MRIPFIAGNWKMYKNIKEAVEFAAIFAPLYHDTDVRTAIFGAFSPAWGLWRMLSGGPA